jgi:diphosphomevalonate decarboxylase
MSREARRRGRPAVTQATGRARANIALCKYWGKLGPLNAPATPSIGLSLAALTTITRVTRRTRGRDLLVLDGKRAAPAAQRRLGEYLDAWRADGLLGGRFHVESVNNFPTASGLASSASGYAALAAALSALATRPLCMRELSRWARRGSGSAARSVSGGLCAMPAGRDPPARRLAAGDDVPWGMVLALVQSPAKEVGSREGMERCRRTSEAYAGWVAQARRDYRAMLGLLRRWDLGGVGELMEANMLAMHACTLAARPPLIYWAPATLALLGAARGWRKAGLEAYATVDAGPHVAILTPREELARVARRVRRVPGVVRAIISLPGGPAEVVERR